MEAGDHLHVSSETPSTASTTGFFNDSTNTDSGMDYSHRVSYNFLTGQDFPGDPMSSATAHVIQTVVQVGLLPVLTLCGVTMNVINMAVFQRQGLSDRINLCLFWCVCVCVCGGGCLCVCGGGGGVCVCVPPRIASTPPPDR